MNWEASEDKTSVLFGSGATRVEKALTNCSGLIGGVGIIILAVISAAPWSWWQYVVAVVIAFDVVGGVVANSLNSAKQAHYGPPGSAPESGAMKLLRHPILFTALHIHPVLVAVVFSFVWWWGAGWYLVILASTITVRWMPLYLQRPVAFALCAVVTLLAVYTPAPQLWAWLPVMLMMKLVLAHAVQEEPYRPAATA